MTDQTAEEAMPSVSASWMMRGRSEPAFKTPEKIVSFLPSSIEPIRSSKEEAGPPQVQRDWSSAIDLIQEASEAIRISEERAGDLEVQIGQIRAQAAEEMRRLEVRIAEEETKLTQSEERARVAEARAQEAEIWLARLHDAVTHAFRRPQATVTKTS